MRQRISRDLRSMRFFIYPLVMMLSCINVYVCAIAEDADEFAIIFVPCLSALILATAIWFYRILDNEKTVEFDAASLYISSKKDKVVVPLGNILSLEMTTIRLNGNFRRKLTYTDNQYTEQSVIFFPRPVNLYLPEFVRLLKEQNPNADIQALGAGPFQIDSVIDRRGGTK